ncbi:MAG: carbohydrate-binding protein [Xanthomonadaceae bacterium]|nr:carbohydrate-binding protein [Xanthomonadaceae bacterium]
MLVKRSAVWSGLAVSALGSVMGTGMSVALLAMLPLQSVAAQSVPACSAAWNATTAYGGGAVASENGTNYLANWWTQGNDPASNNGPSGSGQPWTSEGACSGSSGSGTGTGTGTGTGSDDCAAAWDVATAYSGGTQVSENGENYAANWWNQGDDPATHSGAAGSGQPWTVLGSCTGSSGGSTGGSGSGSGSGGGSGSGSGSGSISGLLFSPYKDVTINLNWTTNVMNTAVTGTVMPVVGSGSLVSTVVPKLGAITLAFATGECGSENWGGVPAASFASANIQPLVDAGLNYVVSTGGQAGAFTCSTPAGMAQFLSRYMSPRMVGVDFDIEGGQTQAQIDSLIAEAAYAHTLYPNLRFSFTLATLAASDGSYGGVNGIGDMVVRAVKAANLPNYTINLMVMDFGSASAGVCVVANGQCDMGQSAIQAALNLEHTYGIPASQIELTPMIGVNDVSSELFSTADVDTVTNYAVQQGLAGLHFWSLDRDTPCQSNSGYASPTCNSVGGTSPLDYTNRFLGDLGR